MLDDRGGPRNSDVVCTTYVFNTHEDFDRSGRPVFGIDLKSINEDRLPSAIFNGREFISYREIFNNLDGDDRSGIPITERYSAGALVHLAAIYYVLGFQEAPEIPKHMRPLIDDCEDVELDQEFDYLLNGAYDELCSVIFGRTFPEMADPEDLRSDIYCVLTDIIWYMILNFENIIANIEDVCCILDNSSNKANIVAYWEPEYMMIKVLDDRNNLDVSHLTNYLKTRGLIQ